MKPFITYTGSTVPINQTNIDTDIIIPTEFLKRLERTGYGNNLMHYWRFNHDGSLNEDFVLNQKAYENATILLTGENFGCGSSRENAVWALYDYGFRAIISPSFADIFKNNSSKNGLLLIELEENVIKKLFSFEEKNPGFTLSIDLENQRIKSDFHDPIHFDIDPHTRMKFLKGIDDIDLTMRVENEILAHEKHRPVYMNPYREGEI
ncbi:3-isopropylmalate dehydratase small subunit [Virgibacillus sp. NKC19-16]|uniref:3-isopropylmalate dehydratase small subunit n=1 Tax=Virgibacillus salidurans TaxID=2831673 RepID=UPI001F40127F|nr:3-isopropylmalate dehydratase small subunit [Virgibacillus sp. NKC19-16]UJL45710.1 3-isopropylmalate dehydratase small subunit [Virgibacillus sp. NKC19-16]